MQMRWGLGPVYVYESLLTARRRQIYAGRSFFVLSLLAGMSFVWITYVPWDHPATVRDMADVGEGFFYALTGIQLSLILLAAPAAAAGSMGMDRARGTILHMFVTDLSDTEIVLGTLAARLTPVCALIVCGVPVTALAALLGGIDLAALAGALVVTLCLALLGCVLALTLSIWVTKTHDVLMAVYVAEGLWVLAAPIGSIIPIGFPAWFWKANPYVLAFSPYTNPGYAGVADFAAFVGGVLAVSAALVRVSIARMRRVVVEQSSAQAKSGRWRLFELKRLFPSWPSPTLDGNPVLWREWHRNQPSRLARRLWAGLLLVTWSLVAWGSYLSVTQGLPGEAEEFMKFGLGLYLAFGLLLLSASAPMSLAEEHVRGSLDVLLATPLSTVSIVLAKWWGSYRRVLMLLLLPLYASAFLAAVEVSRAGIIRMVPTPSPTPLTAWERIMATILAPADFLASGAVIVSLGLALAIWVRRPGRAVALSVIAFFLVAIGWVFLVACSLEAFVSNLDEELMEDHVWILFSLLSLSPIFGPIASSYALNLNPQSYGTGFWIGLAVVIPVKAAVAGLLLWLSVRTFDHRMGRSSGTRTSAGRGKHILRASRRWAITIRTQAAS